MNSPPIHTKRIMKSEVSHRDNKADDLEGRTKLDFGMVLFWFARKYMYKRDRFPSESRKRVELNNKLHLRKQKLIKV